MHRAIALVAVVSLVSCKPSGLVGHWKGTEIETLKKTGRKFTTTEDVTFRSDGTYSWIETIPNDNPIETGGTFTYDEKTKQLAFNQTIFKIAGREMSSEKGPRPPMTLTWKSSDEITFTRFSSSRSTSVDDLKRM